MVFSRRLLANRGLSAQGGFDFAASRHPELAAPRAQTTGPRRKRRKTTPWAASISSEILVDTL